MPSEAHHSHEKDSYDLRTDRLSEMERGTVVILIGVACLLGAIILALFTDGEVWWLPTLALGVVLVGLGWSERARAARRK